MYDRGKEEKTQNVKVAESACKSGYGNDFAAQIENARAMILHINERIEYMMGGYPKPCEDEKKSIEPSNFMEERICDIRFLNGILRNICENLENM